MSNFEPKWAKVHAALGILLAVSILAAPFIADYFLRVAR